MTEIEPYNLFERVALLVMCLNLSSTGAYFVRRWEVWKRVSTAAQNGKLHFYANGCIISAWFFTFMSIIGILFVDFAPIAWCKYSIYTCIVLYWGTKVFIYLYLVERALIVKVGMEFRDYNTVVRLEEKSFQMNVALLCPYVVVLGLMLGYNIAEPTEVERCEIGLKREAALALAIYDTIFSVIITIQFVIPLIRTFRQPSANRQLKVKGQQNKNTCTSQVIPKHKNLLEKLKTSNPTTPTVAQLLRALAIRTLIGSTIALIVSLANMTSLVLYPAQPVAQCLLLCSLDVTMGCILIDFMSREGLTTRGFGFGAKLWYVVSLLHFPSLATQTGTPNKKGDTNKHASRSEVQDSKSHAKTTYTHETECREKVGTISSIEEAHGILTMEEEVGTVPSDVVIK